ncbi:MAG: hypothetical protein M1503_04550 [Thaumarchaeota archaeon]|nr:hypothetical protein [Nitrososphaerota archaeon]
MIDGQESAVIVCGWCGQRLGTGYYFRCKNCSATYCFIHRDRHVCSIKPKSVKPRHINRKVAVT